MLKFKYVTIFFILVFVLAVLLIWNDLLPLYAFLIVFALWALVTFAGATNIRWNYFFASFNKNKAIGEQSIALTFDDGPSENTLEILKILKKYNVKATFFCIGHKIDEHPEIFKQILDDGHQVGNHSYSHSPIIGFFSTKKMINELNLCNRAAKNYTGMEMTLFRPPGGVTNPNIGKALKQTGHWPVGWSVRSFDALLKDKKIIFTLATRNLQKGDVVLLHDTKPHTAVILERLLLLLQKRNFELLTIGSLFKIDVYR